MEEDCSHVSLLLTDVHFHRRRLVFIPVVALDG